jgi:shikimate dehydrogenase
VAPREGGSTVTGTTRVIGIIGDPVSHSLSPLLHNAAFAALGLDLVYVPLPVRAAALGAAVEGLGALGFRGANVTVPHKGAVLPYLSWLDADARSAEAVNTIVVDGLQRRGYNTDVEGVRAALVEACGETLRGASGLLLGAGGAARAAALALARLGVELTVVNRTAAAAERLAALCVAAVPGAAIAWRPLSELTAERVRSSRLLVNATSLGMAGAGKVPAALADNVTAGHVVLDVVYALGDTDLLARARARGAIVVDGLSMLVHQAAAAFTLWTGEPAPLKVMRDAIAQGH